MGKHKTATEIDISECRETATLNDHNAYLDNDRHISLRVEGAAYQY